MAKLHFFIGQLATETVSSDQQVLVLLPQTVHPAMFATYAAQIYPTLQLFVRLGSAKNIFTAHFLPLIGAGDKNALAAKRRELNSVRLELEQFSGDISKRAGVIVNYLSANKLIDRKLYPVVEKLKREVSLTNKDLTPLIDAAYTSLRKTASATSAHKEKIRAYIQSGEYDASLVDWFNRFVDPRFALFQQAARLATEVDESEKSSRVTADPALMRDFCTAVDELAAGRRTGQEIQGVDIDSWVESLVGAKIEPTFFGEVRSIRQGVNNNGAVRLESAKSAQQLETAPPVLPLDQLSRAVTALDRALSSLVMEYANADEEIKRLFDKQPVHYGLLIRAFLGELDAVRTLYPKHVVGIAGKPEVDEAIIGRTRESLENGSIAKICAKSSGLEESTLQAFLEKAVAIQQKTLPLLPFEVHQLLDTNETAGRLKKMVEKLQPADSNSTQPTTNQAQLRALQISLKGQEARGQQLSKRIKADFRVDTAKLFALDESVVDEVENLYGSEMGCLRTILAPVFEAAKVEERSELEANATAEPATEEMSDAQTGS